MSTPFWIKMVLVLLLTGLTVLVRFATSRDANYWYVSGLRRGAATILGAASLLLCVSIVAAGRLIAYISNA